MNDAERGSNNTTCSRKFSTFEILSNISDVMSIDIGYHCIHPMTFQDFQIILFMCRVDRSFIFRLNRK